MTKIKLISGVFLAGSMVFLASCKTQPGDPKTDEQKASYSLGATMAKQFKTQEVKLDLEQFMHGFDLAYKGDKLALTEEQMHDAINKMIAKSNEEAEKKFKELADKNAAEAKKFFEENAKKEGVKVDESGLQYKVVKEGAGESPKVEDKVTVDYEGKLLSGEVFDSSYERGEPASFNLNQVIKGWQIGLQKMKPGAEYMLYIPSDLAYGEVSASDKIGPNSALIFKVELKKVEKAKPKAKSKK